MRIKIFIFATLALLLSIPANALQVVDAVTGRRVTKSDVRTPTVKIIKQGQSYNLNFAMAEFEISSDDLYSGTYQVSLPGFGNIHTATMAGVPYRGYDIILPMCNKTTIRFISCDSIVVPLQVAPARPDLITNDTTGYTLKNVPPISNYFPGTVNGPLYVQSISSYRGNGLITLGICPIKYDHRTKKSVIYSNFRCIISTESDILDAPGAECIQWNNNINNPGFGIDLNNYNQSFCPANDSRDLLIITRNIFEPYLSDFVSWKRKEGYNTHIMLVEDDERPNDIRNNIISFAKQHPSLFAILIIGDIDKVPNWECDNKYQPERYGNTYYSDLYYACLHGEPYVDFMPDVIIGRIPCDDVDQLENALSKILDYETANYFVNGYGCNDIRKALHVAQFQGKENDLEHEDLIFVSTSEIIRDAMLKNNYSISRAYATSQNVPPKYFKDGRELPEELQYPNFLWKDNATNIINAWQDPLNYVFYNGHGNVSIWGSALFASKYVKELSGSQYYPPVFSIACLTGKMNEWSLSDEFLMSKSAGSSGVLAASHLSWTYSNDYLLMGIVKAMFPDLDLINEGNMIYDPWMTIGEAMHTGLKYMINRFVPNGLKQYQVYHWYGDPTMRHYNDNPLPIYNIGLSLSGCNIKAAAPGYDLQISGVYSNGEVVCYRSDEAQFSIWDLETITFTGKNLIPRTLTLNEMSVDNIFENFNYTLDYAVSKNGTIEVHYKAPKPLLIPNVTIKPNEGYILITNQKGKQIYNTACDSEGGVLTFGIPVDDGSNIYNVTMVNNGVATGSTKVYVRL